MYWGRLLLALAVSSGAHLLFGGAMTSIPFEPPAPRPRIVEVKLIRPPPPPPPPEPPPEPEPEPPPPPQPPPEPEVQEVHEPPPKKPKRRRPKPARTAPRKTTDENKDIAPSERAVDVGDTTTTPVFGISMSSTSKAATGPAMPVGNTLLEKTEPTKKKKVKPLAAPAKVYEVTKMPLPRRRCSGRYTEEARAAGIEGTVVLDLIVDEKGRARDIKVVKGLSHGLNKAAVAALKACRFTPGERGGKPVPVRVRGFKIRFFLQDSD